MIYFNKRDKEKLAGVATRWKGMQVLMLYDGRIMNVHRQAYDQGNKITMMVNHRYIPDEDVDGVELLHGLLLVATMIS